MPEKLKVLALFDKPDPLVGPYFEENHLRHPFALAYPHPVRNHRDSWSCRCKAWIARRSYSCRGQN